MSSLSRLIGVLAAASVAAAAPFTLSSGNSSAGGNDANGLVTTWYVDGSPDNVFLTGFYYRLADAAETPVASLGLLDVSLTGNSATLSYGSAELAATVRYELEGGMRGSGRSVLRQSVELTNLAASALDLHLFLYSDFDIRFTPAANLRNFATLVSPVTVLQQDAVAPVQITSTVSAAPDRYEIAENFLDLYRKLFVANGPDDLSNTPATGVRVPDTAGDVAFAFQWSRDLQPGGSFTVASTNEYAAIPEPLSIALVGVGFAIVGLGRPRKRGC